PRRHGFGDREIDQLAGGLLVGEVSLRLDRFPQLPVERLDRCASRSVAIQQRCGDSSGAKRVVWQERLDISAAFVGEAGPRGGGRGGSLGSRGGYRAGGARAGGFSGRAWVRLLVCLPPLTALVDRSLIPPALQPPFDAEKLDALLERASVDVVVATSR